jgi:hypothetical protein
MDQSDHPISEHLSLEGLVASALGELERLKFSRRSRDRYRAVWEHLVEFSHQRKPRDGFSSDLTVRFVKECGGDKPGDEPSEGWRRHIVFGVKVLEEFAHRGRIERGVTET